MAIRSIHINVTDIARSVDFYSRFLGTEAISVGDDAAELDAVTATISLRLVSAAETNWVADDLQKGFRHVGFKVADLDERVEKLHAARVPFQLEPIHAEGDVRITFFYDPDGTLLELVEGPIQYHEVYDQDAVDSDWGLGTPSRPRFDHVAETVADLEVTKQYFGQLGYQLMSGLHQPSDTRGFEINFLRAGDSVLEIFTYERADKSQRQPQTTAPGFLAAEFDGVAPTGAERVDQAHGLDLYVDPDGLVHAVTSA